MIDPYNGLERALNDQVAHARKVDSARLTLEHFNQTREHFREVISNIFDKCASPTGAERLLNHLDIYATWWYNGLIVDWDAKVYTNLLKHMYEDGAVKHVLDEHKKLFYPLRCMTKWAGGDIE